MRNLKLPQKEDVIITYYGCSEFSSASQKIYGLAAVFYEKKQKCYRFFGSGEEEIFIEEYIDFLNSQPEKTLVHWSMNSIKYGFQQIERRLTELTKKNKKLKNNKRLDLSEYLKHKYGLYYVPREGGRLNNLAKKNSFTGFKNKTEIANINDISDRLELIFSIYQADSMNQLKTFDIYDIPDKYKEYFLEYGYEVFKSFNSKITDEIKLAPMSFLISELKRDKLISQDKTFQQFFNLFVEEFDINLGKSTKFKSDISREKYLPLYNQIKSEFTDNK